jgi:hypothetical protein
LIQLVCLKCKRRDSQNSGAGKAIRGWIRGWRRYSLWSVCGLEEREAHFELHISRPVAIIRMERLWAVLERRRPGGTFQGRQDAGATEVRHSIMQSSVEGIADWTVIQAWPAELIRRPNLRFGDYTSEWKSALCPSSQCVQNFVFAKEVSSHWHRRHVAGKAVTSHACRRQVAEFRLVGNLSLRFGV